MALKLPNSVLIPLKAIAKGIENAIVKTLTGRYGLLAKGGLVQSIKVVLKIEDDVSYVIEGNEYADAYIKGRRPGEPPIPIKPLEDWIRRYQINTKPFFNQFTIQQIAFIIQRSIQRKGIVAHPFVLDAIKLYNVENGIKGKLAKELASQIETDFKKK